MSESLQKKSLNDDLNDKEDLIEALSIVTQLYTDKAHLVYELLQNAEDCGAKQVKFIMYCDKLEFYHDGEPFTQNNLTSIRRIGKTTKDSLNKIGKFGVGFKSVFSICKEFILFSTPGNYKYSNVEYLNNFVYRVLDFRYIDELNIVEYKEIEKPFTTKFVFPFCIGERFSGYKTISELYFSLGERLNRLGAEVLLFLKNLVSVKYEIYDSNNIIKNKGEYLLDRKDLQHGCYEVSTIGSSGSKGEENKKYLLYSKPIPFLDNKKSIDIAFAFNDYDENGKPQFIKLACPTITVYFPTDKESKLHFIIQGPFVTPPHRGDVPDDDKDNQYLAQIAAELFEEAIIDLKQRKWLSLDLLELLPYEKVSNNNWLFLPLQKKLYSLLKDSEILPTVNNEYVNAKNAKIADSSDLTDFFCFPLLGDLLKNNDYRWLPISLTDSNPKFRNLYNFFKKDFIEWVKDVDDINYKAETIIKEVSISTIGVALRENKNFLIVREDSWLEKFYTYLADKRPAMLQVGGQSFVTVPFIKTVDNRFVSPYKYDNKSKELTANIFIKPRNAVFATQNYDLNFVNDVVPKNIIAKLHICEPDGYDFFRRELESNENTNKQTNEANISQIKKAFKYLKEEQNGAEELFKNLLYLRVKDTKGNECIIKTKEDIVYFANDFNRISIEKYFKNLDTNIYILDESFYLENGIRESDILLLKNVGVLDNIIESGRDEWDGNYGASCSNYKDFKRNLTISKIDKVLEYISLNNNVNSKDKSLIIFQLLESVKRHLKGQWRNKKTNPDYHEDVSVIIKKLKNSNWVFNEEGKVVRPVEISKNQLNKITYKDLDKNSELFNILDFKKDVDEQIFSIINKLESQYGKKAINIILQEFIKQDESDFDPTVDIEKKEFPNGPIQNLPRLQREVEKRYDEARGVEYESVYRSIRISRGKDREHIGHRYQGFCQMCESPSRFWEVAEIFIEPKKEIEEMNLSFCPSCATEYRYLRKKPEVMQKFKERISDASLEDIRIQLKDEKNDERYIRFTKSHLAEVQTILKLIK